jgi:sec-independent protein translocase protein TatA
MIEHIQGLVAIGMPQGLDWLWIFLIVLLIFGGARLPSIARSIGKSFSEFKKGIREAEETKDQVENDVREIKDDVVNETKRASGLDKNERKE